MNRLSDVASLKANGQTRMNRYLGEVIENWLSRDTPGCAFCNAPDPEYSTEYDELAFCDPECNADYDTIWQARRTLGRRDLRQRGND